jgi:hypothetical protein
MISEGKIICLKTIIGKDASFLLKEGHIYEAKHYKRDEKILGIDFRDISVNNSKGPITYFPISSLFSDCILLHEIEGCYITIADWRDKQIDKILDEK